METASANGKLLDIVQEYLHSIIKLLANIQIEMISEDLPIQERYKHKEIEALTVKIIEKYISNLYKQLENSIRELQMEECMANLETCQLENEVLDACGQEVDNVILRRMLKGEVAFNRINERFSENIDILEKRIQEVDSENKILENQYQALKLEHDENITRIKNFFM